MDEEMNAFRSLVIGIRPCDNLIHTTLGLLGMATNIHIFDRT